MHPPAPVRARISKTLCALAPIPAALVALSAHAQDCPRPGISSAAVTVPFVLEQNDVLVPVRVNGNQPVWLIIDTGASENLIDETAASRMGLSQTGASNVYGGGGSAHGAHVDNVSLAIGDTRLSGQMLLTVPLGNLARYFDRAVVGLVGNSFLQHFVVELNYARRTVTFSDASACNLAAEPDAVEIIGRNGLPFVRVTMFVTNADTITDLLELDSGSIRAIQLNAPFAQAHQILGRLAHIEGMGGSGVGGATRFTDVRLHALRIGSTVLREPVASISEDSIGEGAGSDAGLIGGEILRRFVVTIDLQHRRMLLRPNRSLAEAFESDMSGLELIRSDANAIIVQRVRPGFPAAAAGIRPGDVIEKVNGSAARSMGIDRITTLFREPGRRVTLALLRGSESRSVTLVIRRRI